MALSWISAILLAVSALTNRFGYTYYTTNGFKTTGGTNPYSYGYLYTAHPYNLYFTLLTVISMALLSLSLFLYTRK